MKLPILLAAFLAATVSAHADNLARPIELKRGKTTTLIFNNASEGDQTVHLQLFRGNATVKISSGTNHVANTLSVSAGTPVTFQAHWAIIEAVVETQAEQNKPLDSTPKGTAENKTETKTHSAVPDNGTASAGQAGGGSSAAALRSASDDDLFGFYQVEAAKTPAKPAPKPDVAALKKELKEVENVHSSAVSTLATEEANYKASQSEANKKKRDDAASAVTTALRMVEDARAAVAAAEKA